VVLRTDEDGRPVWCQHSPCVYPKPSCENPRGPEKQGNSKNPSWPRER
jgi:hypothetical protein